MQLFRSEEHVLRWCEARGRDPGAVFTLQQMWDLADAWYRDRLSPDFRRRTPEEAEALFASLGLIGDAWKF